MELKGVLAALVSALSRLDFVTSLDLHTEVFILKGRVYLRSNGFLEVYFNEQTQTLAIAWIANEQRKWGIDSDNLRGWHRHPLGNPEEHQPVVAMSIQEIIQELDEAWRRTHEA
jgi:hypothetical protein